MRDYSIQNKKDWEYNTYEFWAKQSGTPTERAKSVLGDPVGMLKRYADCFDTYRDIKVANICGSCEKKAVFLAVLGVEVTVLISFLWKAEFYTISMILMCLCILCILC